jgi:hypothetical protein
VENLSGPQFTINIYSTEYLLDSNSELKVNKSAYTDSKIFENLSY